MNEPKICAYALGHLNHQGINNKISACFRCSASLGRYDQQLMSEVLNGAEARQHRMTLMGGQWPEGCESCKDFEEIGVRSVRNGGLSRYDAEALLMDYDPLTGAIKHARSIEIRFGNECNLTCRHCGPAFSSRWEALERLDPSILRKGLGRDHEPHTYVTAPGYHEDILDNLVPHLSEIMFSGGETMYQKEHYRFIDAIPAEHASHISLMYVTNGTVTKLRNYDAIKLWRKFKSVKIVISTDGVGEQFNYFRQGADWDSVESNIRLFRDEGHVTNAEITCSVYQMFYLTDTIDYLYDRGLTDEITSSVVQYPALINPRIMPPEAKAEIKANWDAWLAGCNRRKAMDVSWIGERHMTYMMDENTDIYDPSMETPSWDDFSESVRLLDRVFKTDVGASFPRLARYLTR